MNKHGMLKATSVAIALCTVMSSTTFAFSTVASAATVDFIIRFESVCA